MGGRKTSPIGAALGLALLALAPRAARAELAEVWAVGDGVKIAAGDLEHPLSAGNLTYDPKVGKIRLFAARNETIAFQLILEGGGSPTEARVHLAAVGDLDNRGASDAPDRWFVGRRIELFRERYLRVRERSHDLYWKPGSAAEPKLRGRRIPDPLIPMESGDAVRVPAAENRAVWIDLYVPEDAEPGTRRGELRVEVDGRPCDLPACRLTVELEVGAFTLPDRTPAQTMVWFSGGARERDLMAARYLPDPWEAPAQEVAALRRRHFHLARRHRLTFFTNQHRAPTEELRRRLTGDVFRPEAGYEGPGEGLGQDIYVLHAYGVRELAPEQARRWSAWLARVAPGADVIYYTLDEPTPEELAEVNRRAARGAPIPSFTTAPYQPGVEVDVYAALPSDFTVRALAAAREAGKRVWIYNGVRPFSGTFVIDDVAVAPRVNAWIQYRAGIERWFYWEATYYKDAQGGRGQLAVLGRPDNFANPHGDLGNGDGLLVYPGRDLLFPQHDLGLDRPVPSIRLKNWRRGIQDVAYLALARERGHGAFVGELLEALLPVYLADELRPGDPVPWSERGETWLEARLLLAEAITSGEAPPIPKRIRSDFAPRGGRLSLAWTIAALLFGLAIVGARLVHGQARRGILRPRP